MPRSIPCTAYRFWAGALNLEAARYRIAIFVCPLREHQLRIHPQRDVRRARQTRTQKHGRWRASGNPRLTIFQRFGDADD